MKSASPADSVSVTCFGYPIETGAFVSSPKSWKWQNTGSFPYQVDRTDKGTSISIPLKQEDVIVGLGQHVGPVNCRGQFFRLFSTDTFQHIPSARSLYGVYPMLLILGKTPRALFVDSPAEVGVDAGSSKRDTLVLHATSPDFYFTEITGNSAAELFERYIELTGAPFIPPRWAFGYQQSRWSYKSEAEVLSVAENLAKNDIPCDVIHLDIHYMKGYRVFTFDEEKFPDLPRLSRRLKEQGIRLISIIDPGVKAEQGYHIYDQGKEKGYFCQKTDGSGDFVGAVWPGPSVFPDFFRPEVREWWGAQYQQLLDQGISGVWNDMNEPSIFYTPDAFHQYADRLQDFRARSDYGEELANALFDKGVCLKEGYYDEFEHQVEGKTVPHRSVHNLYGTMMTRAVGEFLQKQNPDKRNFLLSRSSYPGMHRYAAIWTGDNHSWWEHLSLNIQMMVSLNISGMLFTGADIGGFSGDCNGELLVRWTQLGAFAPFFRNHAALWSRNQEPWCFDQETLELCRESIKLRYAILPYYYSEFVRAASCSTPFIKGLFFDYPEAWTRLNDDQFCVGHALLVAPVVQAAASGRSVWLPGDHWLKVATSAQGLTGERIVVGGDHWIEASLSQIPVFLKKDSMVAMAQPRLSTMAPEPDSYRIIAFVENGASTAILLDDGEQRYDTWKDYPKAVCSLIRGASGWQFEVTFESTTPRALSFEIELWNRDGSQEKLEVKTAAT